MLQTMLDKLDIMDRRRKPFPWEYDSDEDWSSLIDTEYPEDVNELEDPDYMLPEEVGENSITTTTLTRNYNLRQRRNR